MAVKVTGLPSHTGLEEAETATLTGMTGLTDMVTGFEEAGLPETQVRLDITWQLTTSPFAGT
jgi:hypothetical protein